MEYETLAVTRPRAGVVVATLNRPKQMNAITPLMFDEFRRLCEHVDRDPDVRTLILTGEGRGFCSGLDLTTADELPTMATQQFLALQERWAASVSGFRLMSKPVIAAVNGAAAGAGFALALAAETFRGRERWGQRGGKVNRRVRWFHQGMGTSRSG